MDITKLIDIDPFFPIKDRMEQANSVYLKTLDSLAESQQIDVMRRFDSGFLGSQMPSAGYFDDEEDQELSPDEDFRL